MGVIPSGLNSWLLAFEGPYYFFGTLLFVGVVSGAAQYALSVRRENRSNAVSLLEKLHRRHGQFDTWQRNAETQLPPQLFEPTDFDLTKGLSGSDMIDLFRSRGVALEKISGSLRDNPDCRRAVDTLELFAAEVRRGPMDRELAFRHAGRFYTRQVEVWAAIILRMALDEDDYFFDGWRLYREWRWRLDGCSWLERRIRGLAPTLPNGRRRPPK